MDKPWWKAIPATAWVTWALIVVGFIGVFVRLQSEVMRNSEFAQRHPGEYLKLRDTVTVMESKVGVLEKAAAKGEDTEAAVNLLQVSVERLTQQIIALAEKIDGLNKRLDKKGL